MQNRRRTATSSLNQTKIARRKSENVGKTVAESLTSPIGNKGKQKLKQGFVVVPVTTEKFAGVLSHGYGVKLVEESWERRSTQGGYQEFTISITDSKLMQTHDDASAVFAKPPQGFRAIDPANSPFVFSMTLDARMVPAAIAAISRLPELVISTDKERADAIVKSSIAAAIPLQRGAHAQAVLEGRRITEILSRIHMLTAAEVGTNAGSLSEKPEQLAAQWASRDLVFSIELAGQGIRYPAFQFQPTSGKPWPALSKVLPVLNKAFSKLDLLIWFESPNSAIGGKKPSTILHDTDFLSAVATQSITPIEFW